VSIDDVEKTSYSEPSYLFRADDNYNNGDSIGFELDSEQAIEADIQDPMNHVFNKESGQTSRYTSFSNAISIKGGSGAKKFTKNNKIFKVSTKVLQELEIKGKIRIYSPEEVAVRIRQNPKKKINKEANNVKTAMEKNGEILIEGQIPGNFIVWVK
jgi:hypothetical protein